MLGASLRCRGVELLRRVEDLDAAAESGSTAGIPLLHPWANRLSGLEYEAAGRTVRLDPASPLLHFDGRGLPIHGVPWAKLAWEAAPDGPAALEARLDWNRPELLAVFPFPHWLRLRAALSPEALTIETTLEPTGEGAVPVAFGFHPYFGVPDLPRSQWRLELPAMRRLALDAAGIPTGASAAFGPLAGPLGGDAYDDGFTLPETPALLVISGANLRIAVEIEPGFAAAQVYAPPAKDFVALEPMTAPTAALSSGRGLPTVAPGGRFTATFRIRVSSA
jgi:galactose mutarotase-like enzyme